jgi:hypothetical protein
MKAIVRFLALVITSITVPLIAAEPWEAEYNKLLGKYVTAGGVKYAAWKASAEDVAALNRVTDAIAAAGPSEGSKEGQFAYHINAYNAWMLRTVLDNYPLKSVRDIAPLFGVFTQDRITVAGKKMSFNYLEKTIMIKQFADPRLHVAINCASASCPPISSTAYSGGRLNGQLDIAAKKFTNSNPNAVQLNGNKLALSKIFDWYAADFKASGGAVGWINKYREQDLPADAKVSFQEYDWSLNEAK